QLGLPQVNAALISNENQKTQKEREIIELRDRYIQEFSAFTQSLHTLRALIEEWKKKFVLIAPVDGKLAFSFFISEQLQLKQGQEIGFVNPENSSCYAQIIIPQSNFARIKLNQSVLLKLPAYPHHEFGHITGNLSFISPVPTDSGYLAKVNLPYQLVTNFKKNIQYREGLMFSAEIITSDMRLLERFYAPLVKNVLH
ncbi:MAG: HlyD family secretion protein, partial [Chitinophagaceae bacterium]